MKSVPLSTLFDVEYGNQFDLNKMVLSSDGVNFVSRSSRNLGIVAKVAEEPSVAPYDSDLITVTLGGTYLLSSFVQPKRFYTAQNIKVLRPKLEMDFATKVFYAICITRNRFRYSSHGREANRSLDSLLVPCLRLLPDWLSSASSSVATIDKSASVSMPIDIGASPKLLFKYKDLFDIKRGTGARKGEVVSNGITPLVTSIDKNNGVIGYVNTEPAHNGNVISVNRNGSVGEAYFQARPFCSTEDVHVFAPRFEMNIFHAMYLIPLIRKEQYRYSYGRKWGLGRMNSSEILLPEDGSGQPDWSLIEAYVRTLPYSRELKKTISN